MSTHTQDAGRSALDRVLSCLEDVRPSGSTGQRWTAKCPAHVDGRSSLGIVLAGGQMRFKCFAGCKQDAIIDRLGLKPTDLRISAGVLAPQKPKGRRHARANPPRPRATVQHSPVNPGTTPAGTVALGTTTPAPTAAGCTLAQYAERTQLPEDFLRGLGLSDTKYQGDPAVRIPYFGEDGGEAAVRYRTALEKTANDDNRFRWKTGSKLLLYGLRRLPVFRQAGRVVLVEGESDTHTLWHHDEPALGIPGANNWNEQRDAPALDGITSVYIVVEPDTGGEAVLSWLATSSIRDRARLVRMPAETKDPSALYLSDPTRFAERWHTLLDAALPWTELARAQAEAERTAAWEDCHELANEPDILSRFAREVAADGLAGEERVAKLLYLVVTSRLLEQPASAAVKGPSAGGKSYVTAAALRYFPPSACYVLTAMSERALAYSTEPLSHRMLVLYEAAGLSGEFASYLIRSLLSEGRVRYETVEKTPAGLQPRLIEREGPTGLLVTTTALALHAENETRVLSIGVTDTREQTRAVLRAQARDDDDRAPRDLVPWHALQEWLATAAEEPRVSIPFAPTLAELTEPVALRMRRDFRLLLTLVRTHALLHQATRERDDHDRIVATLVDYAAVRSLVSDLIAEAGEVAVPDSIRETVAAVKRLIAEDAERHVTVVELAQALWLDKSSASRRVKAALQRGYLANHETHRGRPAKIGLGAPLPNEVVVLPTEQILREALLKQSADNAAAAAGATVAPTSATAPAQENPGATGGGCSGATENGGMEPEPEAQAPSPPDNDDGDRDGDDPPPNGSCGAPEASTHTEQSTEQAGAGDSAVTVVDSPAGLNAFLAALDALDPSVHVVLDTEATALEPWEATPLLLQLLLPTGGTGEATPLDNAATFVIVLPAFAAADLAPLFMALGERLLLGHNLDYDLRLLGYHYQLAPQRIYDTMIADAMLSAGDFDRKDQWLKHLGLAKLAERYLKVEMDKGERLSFTTVTATPQWRPTTAQVLYAARDVQVLPSIYRQQMERLQAEGLVAATTLRMAALPAIVAMELRGVRVDADQWRRWLGGQEEIEHAEVAILQAAFAGEDGSPSANGAINLRSTQQVHRALQMLGLKLTDLKKETLARVVTDARLTDQQRAVVMSYQRWKAVQHTHASFGETILAMIRPETGRLYGHFNVQLTATGRMSSERPNFQNFPTDPALRAAFVADPGCQVVTADFKSEELAISAALSGDPALRQAISEGRDLYRELASTVYGVPVEAVTVEQRKHGKAALLGVTYGQTAAGLARLHQIPRTEGDRLLQAIRRTYPTFSRWSDAQVTHARAHGWAQSATGAKRYFREQTAEDWKLATEARNAPVQGTAADIMYRLIARLHSALAEQGSGAYLANVVHDEVVIVCPEATATTIAELVKQEMQTAFEDILPSARYGVRCGVEVHVASHWAKA